MEWVFHHRFSLCWFYMSQPLDDFPKHQRGTVGDHALVTHKNEPTRQSRDFSRSKAAGTPAASLRVLVEAGGGFCGADSKDQFVGSIEYL